MDVRQHLPLAELLMFAWKMNLRSNLFGLISGLPMVGLGSFAVQTSIERLERKELNARRAKRLRIVIVAMRGYRPTCRCSLCPTDW